MLVSWPAQRVTGSERLKDRGGIPNETFENRGGMPNETFENRGVIPNETFENRGGIPNETFKHCFINKPKLGRLYLLSQHKFR